MKDADRDTSPTCAPSSGTLPSTSRSVTGTSLASPTFAGASVPSVPGKPEVVDWVDSLLRAVAERAMPVLGYGVRAGVDEDGGSESMRHHDVVPLPACFDAVLPSLDWTPSVGEIEYAVAAIHGFNAIYGGLRA